jgi:hypothetical protein
MRIRPRNANLLNKADVPQPGEHYGVPRRPYTYGGSGKPDGGRTYTVEGTIHRFDGTCHETCEDVR